MSRILEVRNLTKKFGKNDEVVAVNNVSFDLEEGEKLAIIGESGSGKSTIVNMLTRIIDATSGTVILDGEDITNLTGVKLRGVYEKMQMVFQTPTDSFDPRRTLGDGVAESLTNRGTSKKEALLRAEELMGQCGLDASFVSRYPHEVSGGQCQRAAIARALAIGPKLLILDEATSALDVTIQKEILELLTRLKSERNISYLFICHDIALVQNFCDRVLVMYKGQIVEEGTPDQVIGKPANEYTKSLIDSVL